MVVVTESGKNRSLYLSTVQLESELLLNFNSLRQRAMKLSEIVKSDVQYEEMVDGGWWVAVWRSSFVVRCCGGFRRSSVFTVVAVAIVAVIVAVAAVVVVTAVAAVVAAILSSLLSSLAPPLMLL